MAKTTSQQKAPRGTNILIGAFTESLMGMEPRWRKVAGLAALKKLSLTVKSMPTWKEPKVQATAKKSTPAIARTSAPQASPTARSARATKATATTAAASNAPTPRRRRKATANGTVHPEPQA